MEHGNNPLTQYSINDANLLIIYLDLNHNYWTKTKSLDIFLNSVLLFLNAYLMLNYNNRFAIYASISFQR